MTDSGVRVDRTEPVAIVRIDRPEVHNALNRSVLAGLEDALRVLTDDDRVRAIVLTGTGEKAFSAGADVEELAGLDAYTAHEVLASGQRVLQAVASCPVPVVAAVNGLALGGGFELVMATAFAVCSHRASFGLPESGLGLIPGYGGTQRLPRLVGPAVAAHTMLSGARISATRAHELGLSPVEPVDPADLLDAAGGIAHRIAARGPRANAAILSALRVSTPRPADLALETALAAIATGGTEAAEGMAAFREKRHPTFAGRQEGDR